jgi:anti-sigma B factor antagonist
MPALSVTIENIGDNAVLRCKGRIVAGESTRILRDAVMCQVDSRYVVLDLAGVTAIDAAGLGSLVFLQTLAHVAGFELTLMNPTRQARELLVVTKLERTFDERSPQNLEGLRDGTALACR